jgi:hypothetical protein
MPPADSLSDIIYRRLPFPRNIYGFRRIAAKIHDLSEKINTAQQKYFKHINIDEADFGFTIPSENPTESYL